MSDEQEIVVVGSCMMDFVSYVKRLPKSGETIHGTQFSTNFGGKGANQCIAASKLGCKCALVANVGDDTWGKNYIANLNNLGINTRHVLIKPLRHTGIAQIIVSESGENQIVIVAGANEELEPGDLKYVTPIIDTCKVLICQLETAPEVAIEALKLAKGISILNGAPGLSKYDEQLLKLPTIFCVNETEASMFTGVSVRKTKDAEKAVKSLLKKGCNSVIVTLGKNGALYASQTEPTPLHVKCPKVECVDATGAGDAFLGALAYALTKVGGISMKRAVEFACHVASDSTTRPGTQISFPGAEITGFLK